MDRQKKIESLMSRQAEDQRRLALDDIDAEARKSNTWGTATHRNARDRVEVTYEHARQAYRGILAECETD